MEKFIPDNKIIPHLPHDIKVFVFKEFLEKKIICEKVLDWFNTNYHLKCSASEIENEMNIILQDEGCINYLTAHNKFFKLCYNKHFIDNEKSFEKMNKTQSLITSIIMYMWH